MGKKVLLVNLNLVQQPAVAPYALDILATSLTNNGHDVDILDLTPQADNWELAVDNHFSGNSPDFVGITLRNAWDLYFPSLYSLPDQGSFLPSHRRVIDRIAEHFPRDEIIAGGVGFSTMPQVMLKRLGLSKGIIGAGEGIFLDIMECNHLSLTGPVRRDFVDNSWYYEQGESIGLRTTNGCMKECAHCPEKIAKGTLFRNSLENILAEITQLFELGVRDIHLNDSETNMPFDFSKQVARYIIDMDFPSDLRFWSYMQPSPFDEEYAGLWKRAGMAGINFGPDHTDPEMLKRFGKWYSPKDIERTTKICNDQGIAVMHELLFGMHGEDPDSVKRAIDFVWGLNPHVIGTTIGIGILPTAPLSRDPRVIAGIKERDEEKRIRNHGIYCKGVPLEDPTYLIDPSIEIPSFYDELKTHVGERVSKIMIPTQDSLSSSNNQLICSERVADMTRRNQKGAHWYYYPSS